MVHWIILTKSLHPSIMGRADQILKGSKEFILMMKVVLLSAKCREPRQGIGGNEGKRGDREGKGGTEYSSSFSNQKIPSYLNQLMKLEKLYEK